MKITYTLWVVFIVMVSGLFQACSDDTGMEGMEIHNGKISVYEPPCMWMGLDMNLAYVINSEEELKAHLTCDPDGVNINFNDSTILFAAGCTIHEVGDIKWQLRQKSSTEYVLMLEITLKSTPAMNDWCIALKSPKLPPNSTAELVVNYIN